MAEAIRWWCPVLCSIIVWMEDVVKIVGCVGWEQWHVTEKLGNKILGTFGDTIPFCTFLKFWQLVREKIKGNDKATKENLCYFVLLFFKS